VGTGACPQGEKRKFFGVIYRGKLYVHRQVEEQVISEEILAGREGVEGGSGEFSGFSVCIEVDD